MTEAEHSFDLLCLEILQDDPHRFARAAALEDLEDAIRVINRRFREISTIDGPTADMYLDTHYLASRGQQAWVILRHLAHLRAILKDEHERRHEAMLDHLPNVRRLYS